MSFPVILNYSAFIRFSAVLMILFFVVCGSGCNSESENKSPQVADINSVGCLIANDFYAVHFSAYLQPTDANSTDRESLLKPFCQELPVPGKVFFAADLIDRDVRKTPIGIRIVEVDAGSAATPATAKEIRTLAEIPPKLYPRGVVEAQQTIDKVGDYALILIIGGEEALSEDDKLHVPFHVGKKLFALSSQMLFILAAGLALLIAAIYFFIRYRMRR